MICQNCKHWEHNDFGRTKDSKRLGSCLCEKFRAGYALEIEEIMDDEVWVENDEGWAFYTGKDFGCIHFEKVNQS